MKPIVAIVGRPNVGKSTLFNQLLGKRIAIIKDTPGVTRDRIYADTEWLDYQFTLVDTGGIDTISDDELVNQMLIQAKIAMDTASVIVFMVDGREGINPIDMEVADLLRKVDKPVVLAVNKVDIYEDESLIYEFYNLGLDEPFPISSSHKRGLGDMLDAVVQHFPKHQEEEDNDIIKIAVIGKPNSGKSSIVNKILGEERAIVSDIAGTTRDATDSYFMHDGRKYAIIDTAGMRRKSKIHDDIEQYSVMRALGAIRRCDIALIVIDSDMNISEQDAKIAGLVHEEGKGSIIVMNKWDLVTKDTHTINEYTKKVYEILSFMTYAPSIYISALTGQRFGKILDMVDELNVQLHFRISTGVFNECLGEAVMMNEPPIVKGRRLKILYGTQVAVNPPSFTLFVNDSNLVHYSYRRYLENFIRKTLGLINVPIKIFFRSRNKD